MTTIRRTIDINVENAETREPTVFARLDDSYHEMEVKMRLRRPGLVVESIEARMLRGTDALCELALSPIQGLIGLSLGKGFRRKVIEQVGGTRGCTHMTNLILQISECSIIFSSDSIDEDEAEFAALSRDPRWQMREKKAFWLSRVPELRDACVGYEAFCRDGGGAVVS